MKLPAPSGLRRFIALFVGILLTLFVSADAKPKQPVMHATLDSLHAARSATDPVPDLEAALSRIKAALHNKAGYRVEAAALVRQAMDAAKAKNRRAADQLIDEAITKIEKGIAAGN